MHMLVIGVVDGGWAQYRSIKWSMKKIESSGSICEPYLYSRNSKHEMKDIGQPFVAYPAI